MCSNSLGLFEEANGEQTPLLPVLTHTRGLSTGRWQRWCAWTSRARALHLSDVFKPEFSRKDSPALPTNTRSCSDQPRTLKVPL